MLYNGGNIDMYCTAEPEDISLNLEMAVPLGLILNEAITNALKYAFTDRSTGEIRISCTRAEGMYTISISDNGIGLPEHFDPQQSPTLGFRLIRELTRQLRGSFSYRSGNGTEITIRLNT
jgi:two-component sensor histidine kinase